MRKGFKEMTTERATILETLDRAIELEEYVNRLKKEISEQQDRLDVQDRQIRDVRNAASPRDEVPKASENYATGPGYSGHPEIGLATPKEHNQRLPRCCPNCGQRVN